MTIETFTLNRERCLLVNINLRAEMNGKESKPAVDLAFEFSGANNLLLKLNPALRAALYRADDTVDFITADHMPHLNFPLMGPIPWELEIPRTRLQIHDVDNEKHDVVLSGGKTNKFKLTPLQGGTVKFQFRCQFSKPDEDSIAKLMRVMNQKIPVSLDCTDEEAKPDNFAQADLITKAPHSAARDKAESLFDKPGTTLALAAPDQVETEPVTLDPAKPKRVTKPAAEAAPAADAAPKAKRASRKAVEVE
jgi:hypothetical protein